MQHSKWTPGRAALVACALVAPTLSLPTSANARSSLKVQAPVAGVVPSGSIPVRARLAVKRSAHVRVARFYVNGRRVTTDRHYPFKTKRGVVFDTTRLPPAGGSLKLKVRYARRNTHGRRVTRTLRRNVALRLPGSTPSTPGEPGCDPTTLNDDFDGSALKSCYWNTQRHDPDSGTIPYYAYSDHLEGAGYSSSPANVSVGDGVLTLNVTNTPIGSGAHVYPKSTGSINSDSKFSFLYGTIKARARVTKCDACWPSFWLRRQDYDWPPEIDIFEFMTSGKHSSPWTTVHPYGDSYTNSAHSKDVQTQIAGPSADLTGGWHVYTMTWTPTKLQFSIDGGTPWVVSDPDAIPHEPMYPILSMAIGDPLKAPSIGWTIAPAPAGSQMQVDYVRVTPLNQ